MDGLDFFKENISEEDMQKVNMDLDMPHANIKVIGIGGAGSNMVDWLYRKGIQGAEILACNTDLKHLNIINVDKKFLIGKELTKGLGCGGFPEKGLKAAEESIQELKESLKGSDMVFVCAGMGGGTGTGAAPVIAKVAKEMGAIVIGTVTMPFKTERARITKAEMGLMQMRQFSDTVIVIDNERLLQIAGSMPINQAFAVANELIATMIKGIVETIEVPSMINLDFADVKSIMTGGGVAVIGVGASDTNNRVEEASRAALSNPLLDVTYEGAKGALVHISGGPDLTLEEANRAVDLITEGLDEGANVIFGVRTSKEMEGKITVMAIISGIKSPWVLGKIDEKNISEKKTIKKITGIEFI